MSKAEPLYRLQLLDTDLDQSKRSLRETEAALASNPAVEHARAEAATVEKVRLKMAAHVRSLDLDVRSLEARLKEDEERLYSGQVKVPKEMLDLQREIESLRHRQVEMNDILLAAMLELDEAQSDANRCQAMLDEATRHWESDSVALRRQSTELKDRISANTERRNAICAAIQPGDLAVYTALRAKKSNNVAVAPIKGKACGQCGEAPSSMQAQQARGEVLVMCPNCGRILYAV